LVKRCENPEGIDEGGELGCVLTVLFEVEDALADFDKELIVVVHLFDDLDKVGNELLLNATMTCISEQVPRTAPIADILAAALSFKEALSLLSSSI
jgi:hypothetical protein